MDYFDTEEFEDTPEFTDIDLPGVENHKKEETPTKSGTFASPAPRKMVKVYIPHKQNAEFLKNLSPAQSLINLDSLASYTTPLHQSQQDIYLNLFSTQNYRDQIQEILTNLPTVDEMDFKLAVENSNPYTEAKGYVEEFNYRNVARMANLLKLDFERQFAKQNNISESFYFLTIGDKGGYSEFLMKLASENFLVPDIRGWCLYPSGEFDIEGVTLLSSESISFSDVKTQCENLEEELGTNEFMLIISDFKVKVDNLDKQETDMKMNIIYTYYLATRLLAKGGTLLLKLYQTHHPATIGLLYLLYNDFDEISLVKPYSVAQQSASKYVLCLNYKQSKQPEISNLAERLESLKEEGKDLEQIIEVTKILECQEFMDYVNKSNQMISASQINALRRLDSDLNGKPIKLNKDDIKDRCQSEWGIRVIQEPAFDEEYYKFAVGAGQKATPMEQKYTPLPTENTVKDYGHMLFRGSLKATPQSTPSLARIADPLKRTDPEDVFKSSGHDTTFLNKLLSRGTPRPKQPNQKLPNKTRKKPPPAPTSGVVRVKLPREAKLPDGVELGERSKGHVKKRRDYERGEATYDAAMPDSIFKNK